MRKPTPAEMMTEDAGKGISSKLSDNAFWVALAVPEALLDALQAFDQAHTGRDVAAQARAKAELAKQLRAAPPLPEVNAYIADLLERYRFTLAQAQGGRRRTPLYDLTETDRRLELAKGHMRDLIAGGRPQGEALRKAAAQFNVKATRLSAYYDGTDTGLRRRRAKLPK